MNAYNFTSQDVFVTQLNPGSYAYIPPNKLAIAYDGPDQSIQIYDINIKDKYISLPLITNSVKQIIYCEEGNYLAVLGKSDNAFIVHVYFNWWIERHKSSINIKMAGSKLERRQKIIEKPDSSSLEIVQIVLDKLYNLNTRYICSCQKTGNIAICYGMLIAIYQFKKSSSLSGVFDGWANQDSNDFTILFNVKLNFSAWKINLCENILASSSYNHVQIIQIMLDEDSSILSDKPKYYSQDNCIEWDFNNHSSIIVLPSMFVNTSTTNNLLILPHAEEILGPVGDEIACKVKIELNSSSTNENQIYKSNVKVLLCRHFVGNEQNFKNESDTNILNIFLVPIYKSTDSFSDPLNAAAYHCSTQKSNPLISSSFFNLKNCFCFISTKFYCLLYRVSNNVKLIQTIDFEGSVKDIAIDNDVLHILTESSLVTYAIGHFYEHYGFKPPRKPLQLNFRPFLSMHKLLTTSDHLLLISSLQNSSSTVYFVKKPSLLDFYQDTCDTIQMLESNNNFASCWDLVLHLFIVTKLTTDQIEVEEQFLDSIINLFLKNFIKAENDFTHSRHILTNFFSHSNITMKNLIPKYHDQEKIIAEYLLFKLSKDSDILSELRHPEEIVIILQIVKNYKSILVQILWNLGGSNLDMESIIPFIEFINSDEGDLIKAKVFLDYKCLEDAKILLQSVPPSNLIHIMCQHHQKIIKDDNFTLFLADTVPEVFQQFLVYLLDDSVISLSDAVNLLADTEKMCDLLDSIMFQTKHVLDADMLMKLARYYLEDLKRLSKKNGKIFKYNGITPELPSWLGIIGPKHNSLENSEPCFCSKCCIPFAKLQYLLINLNDFKLKRKILKDIENFDSIWSYPLQILSLEFDGIIRLLLEKYPEAVVPYALENYGCNKQKLLYLFDYLIETRMSCAPLDLTKSEDVVVHNVLVQLSEILNPTEFVSFFPPKTKDITLPYFKRCLEKYKASQLKEKIVNLGIELKSMMN